MIKGAQAAWAAAFRERHHRAPPLLLPNVWDGASARIFNAAGFDVIATTSGGVAWALGYGDGERAPWPEICAATARIIRAARCAVTIDLEGGYAASRDELRAHVAEIIRLGAIGINLEDGQPGNPQHILPLDEAVERLRAARAAADAMAVPIVINARIDLFLASRGKDLSHFDEAVARAQAYLAAGADCLYPIGLNTPEPLARFVAAVRAPVNAMATPSGPGPAELARLGVARVSTATTLAVATIGKMREIARDLNRGEGFDALACDETYPSVQQLFA